LLSYRYCYYYCDCLSLSRIVVWMKSLMKKPTCYINNESENSFHSLSGSPYVVKTIVSKVLLFEICCFFFRLRFSLVSLLHFPPQSYSQSFLLLSLSLLFLSLSLSLSRSLLYLFRQPKVLPTLPPVKCIFHFEKK